MADPLKVLLDVSIIGIGVLHPEMRIGGFRVDERLVDHLASSGVRLAFCANHSSVTLGGVAEYVRTHPALAGHPVIGSSEARWSSFARRRIDGAYRAARRIFPVGSLPAVLRAGGQLLDRRIHAQVTDTPEGADIFHSTHFPLPPRTGGRSPERFLTLYDLRYRRFPELYDERSIAVGEEILKSIGPNDWVITTSEASRAEIVAEGVAGRHQVFVVPLAADPLLFHPCHDAEAARRVRSRYGIGDAPYILSVNGIDIRKNMHQAVRAFTRLVRQERVGDLQFVICGPAGSGSSLMTAALAEAADLRGRIVHAGFVADEDLAALYSGALVFLYPSIYEGFGLPPLEAMQCGTPVITSNGSSLPEVVSDAGLMFPADDIDALCAAILEIVTKPDLRRALAKRSLLRASHFSWERMGREVLAAYRAAIQAEQPL